MELEGEVSRNDINIVLMNKILKKCKKKNKSASIVPELYSTTNGPNRHMFFPLANCHWPWRHEDNVTR